jgi:hypothetical protein
MHVGCQAENCISDVVEPGTGPFHHDCVIMKAMATAPTQYQTSVGKHRWRFSGACSYLRPLRSLARTGQWIWPSTRFAFRIHDHGMYSYVECSWTKTFQHIGHGTVVVVETDEFMRYICRDGVLTAQIHGPNIAVYVRERGEMTYTKSNGIHSTRVTHAVTILQTGHGLKSGVCL